MVWIPGCRIICNETVGHHNKGQLSSGQVLRNHVYKEPAPPVHLLQVDCGQEVARPGHQLARHAHRQEGLPAKPVTPGSDVEGEQDGYNMLGYGDDIVEINNLSKYNDKNIQAVYHS